MPGETDAGEVAWKSVSSFGYNHSMNFALNPEILRFIDDQVRAGRYASPQAVVEAAIIKMRDAEEIDDDLDDETIAAINEGEEQGDRGEGIELAVFKEQWRQRLGGK